VIEIWDGAVTLSPLFEEITRLSEALPLTATGKLMRRELKALAASGAKAT